jgi:hypothetical protein
MGMDPTDPEKINHYVQDVLKPQHGILPGEIVLWDAHFGPNEGGLPLNRLMDNSYFRLINVFRPDVPFQVLGGHDYEIFIFERTEDEQQVDNRLILEQLLIEKDAGYLKKELAFYDFESSEDTAASRHFSSEYVHAGSYSLLVNENTEFIPGIEMSIKDLDPPAGSRIYAGIFHHFMSFPHEDPPLFVLSLENQRKIFHYQTQEIRPEILHQWEGSSFELKVPETKSPNDILKVYLWNKGGHRVYLDDFSIVLKVPFEDRLN